jgi:PAS domain-containing protein
LAYAWNRSLFREVRLRTAEFQESEQRFRLTFEQAAVGIAHVGLDGQWLRVNQKLCDIVGYTREELSRRTFQDITYPEDLDVDLALCAKRWLARLPLIRWRNVNPQERLADSTTVAPARGPRTDSIYLNRGRH